MTGAIRKLAIVGASARAAAFSAIRAGYEVVAADLFADADLARVANVTRIENYPDGFADWLAATECDAWMYTGALENYPVLVDRMATIRPLLGNSGAALRDVRDPMKLQDLCRDIGVPFPETRTNAEGLTLDSSWLCKTYRGASGSGVWALDGDAAFERAIRENAVFQKVAPGASSAAIFVLSAFGAMPFGTTHQWIGEREGRHWQYAGSIGPVDAPAEVRAQLGRFATELANRFGLRGLAGIDFLIDEDQAWIVEVNPRYTASMELFEQAIPFNTVGFHVVACRATEAQELLDLVTNSDKDLLERVFAKLIVYAPQEAAITQEFSDWAMGRRSLDLRACRLADIPNAGEVIPVGRPVLTAFARGDSAEECERELHEWVAEILAHLYRGS